MPQQLVAVRQLGQALSDAVHIGLQARVFHHTIFLQHLLVRLGAFDDFGLLRHNRALGLAGDRVDHSGTAATQQGDGKQSKNRQTGGQVHEVSLVTANGTIFVSLPVMGEK